MERREFMNTQDLGKFGFRELDIAGDILKALANPSKTTQADDLEMGDGVKLEFNPNSGNVFIVDEDGNTAMMNDTVLENWIYCPSCNFEGFKNEFKKDKCPECKKKYK